MPETIWLMDSDFCDNCGSLLDPGDYTGLCNTCYDLYIAETNEDDWYDFDEDDEEVFYIGEYDQEMMVMPKSR